MCTTPQHILVTEGDLKEPPHSTAVLTLLFAALALATTTYIARSRQPIPDGPNIVQAIIEIGALLLVGILTVMVTRRVTHISASHTIHRPAVLCWCGFMMATIVGSLNSWSTPHSLAKTGILLGLLLIALALSRTYGPIEVLFSLHKAVVVVILIAVGVSLVFPVYFPLFSHSDTDQRERLMIFNNSPVYTAYLVGIAFIVGLGVSRGRSPKLHAFRQIVLLAAVLLSETRWALFCVIMMTVYWLVKTSRDQRESLFRMAMIVSLSASALLTAMLASRTASVVAFTDRMVGTNAGIREGVFELDGRLDLWKTLTRSQQLNWYWGHGLDGDRYILRNAGSWADHAHFVFAEVLLSSGPVGLVGFLLAIVLVMRRWLIVSYCHEDLAWLTALLGFWIVDSLLDPMLLSAAGVVVLGILLASPNVISTSLAEVRGNVVLYTDRICRCGLH